MSLLENLTGNETADTPDGLSTMPVMTEMFNIGSGIRNLFEDPDSLDL